MVGGFDARRSQFNRATQAMRQPGSTFKPFVYMTALDNGYTPATIIVDGPYCVFQTRLLGRHCFKNFTGGYAGPQTMRWGIEQSRNLMTVRAAYNTGMEKVVANAKAWGLGDYPAVLAISLGAGETTVARMTNAFSMMANGGKKIEPVLIDLIQDRHGKTIFRADGRPCEGCNVDDWQGEAMPRPGDTRQQVMDAGTAYQMVHILEGVVQRGTATVLRDLDRPLFGKTGTTNGPNDVWFVGGTPDLVAGIYIGYDTPRSLGGAAQGGRIAAPVFRQFAQGTVHGHARHAELVDQLLLGRHARTGRQRAVADLAQHMVLDLLIQRERHLGCGSRFALGRISDIHDAGLSEQPQPVTRRESLPSTGP